MAIDMDTCTKMHGAPPRGPEPGGRRDGRQTGRGKEAEQRIPGT